MKIAIFEVEKWQQEIFTKEFGADNEVVCFEEPITPELLSGHTEIEQLIIFVNSKVTKEILDLLPKLQCIATMSTGYDHIDLAECTARKISVATVPSYGEVTVAEHTFALILSVSRRIVEGYERVKNGYFSPQGLTGFDLFGKTLGVVGVGGIGKNVIKIGKGFGMNVIGYKRSPDPALEQELGIKIMDFDTLLSTSDIITFHVPYTPETHHMMSEEKFHIVKKGAVIINTARGAIIDTRALLQALDEKIIAGAGLDVVEGEPMLHEEVEMLSKEFNQEDLLYVLEEKMLLNFPNVIITPHNAFNTKEALERIIHTTIDNVKGFKNGAPQNIVEIKSH